MIVASQLREGMLFRFEGQTYKVLDVEVKAGGAKLGGVVKTRVRNIDTARLWDHNFRHDERLEELAVDRVNMEFLYGDHHTCTFMNPETFEQVEIRREALGEGQKFLQEGMKLPVEFFAGQPISIVFPPVVEVRVMETAPPVHAQQDSTLKEAKLENGVEILVPLFIAPGELIRVEVQTRRYVERARRKVAG